MSIKHLYCSEQLYHVGIIAHNKNFSASPRLRVSASILYQGSSTRHDITGSGRKSLAKH
ncbi:MAG: hypothetical protein F6K41_30605 [Symploca sp. SIO3E6]|nr:hypothetical protein [Caldora sp. SIO3E6]